ncbi:MAG: NAD(P)H dehydrogenase subunit NdhS [Cyanobacteriota bacterium]|nr:NAD(P)H dehydrogenase subunit NdhS [Cyanobacteriota bacterium]
MTVTVVLPGCTVKVIDPSSIYRGYKGIVQRLSGDKAAVLFEGGCWDKLVTLPLGSLELS